MKIPTFTNERQVYKYLRDKDSDPIVLTALDEYWDIILCDTPIDEVSFEELNEWIESQVNMFWAGYEEYYNDIINV